MTYNPLELAEAYVQAAQFSEALKVLDAHLQDQPHDDEARRLRVAVRLRGSGETDLQAALADLDRLSESMPDDWRARIEIALRLEPESGLEVAAQAVGAYPGDVTLAELYVERLLAAGRWASALAVVEAQSVNWRWLALGARIHAQSGAFTAAEADYARALERLEQEIDTVAAFGAGLKADLLLRRASCALEAGHLDMAEAGYRAAQRLIADDPSIAFNLGVIAALRGDLVGALELCGDALARAPAPIREQMETALAQDRRLAVLALLLLQGDSDS